MMKTAEKLSTVDPVWSQIRDEATQMARNEPGMSGFLHATILNFDRLEMAIASHLSEKLANSEMGARSLCEVFEEAFADNQAISEAMRADIV
ncbi:MAG: serine O-acetyltransferase, partial [PS1 clade bacterium]|nr:serine O-acetyltransferase [PS1 clade bacterium]